MLITVVLLSQSETSLDINIKQEIFKITNLEHEQRTKNA